MYICIFSIIIIAILNFFFLYMYICIISVSLINDKNINKQLVALLKIWKRTVFYYICFYSFPLLVNFMNIILPDYDNSCFSFLYFISHTLCIQHHSVIAKVAHSLNAQVNWVHCFNQGFTIGFENHLSPDNKSKRYSECLYCKWLLKNWHSHLANTSHLSQTNEGLALQSEIDISLWTSTRIFWILREVHSSHGTAEAPLSSSFCQRGEKDCPVDLPCSSIFTHSSWAMAAEIWPTCWMDDPGIHFVAMRLSAIEI